MVRHDPRNVRGPSPPGGRKNPTLIDVPAKPTSLFTLRPSEEYEVLWSAELIRLDSAIRNIEAYIEIGLPNADVGDLGDFIDRLHKLKIGNT